MEELLEDLCGKKEIWEKQANVIQSILQVILRIVNKAVKVHVMYFKSYISYSYLQDIDYYELKVSTYQKCGIIHLKQI